MAKTKTKTKVDILEVHPILDDTKISNKEGCYFPESHYRKVITSNADVYGILEDGTKQLLLKLTPLEKLN